MQAILNDQRVTFGRPVIGPKHYIAVAGGGWTETFGRKESTQALLAFIGRLTICELVNNFLDHIELANKKKVTWSDVTLYLSRITRVDTDKIPMAAAVAFWAEVTMVEDAKDSN
jgi:hypothetical protein